MISPWYDNTEGLGIPSRAGPLVCLPAWLRMPSRLQRQWLSYGLKGMAAAWAVQFLFRHSSLAGSDDLERCVSHAARHILPLRWAVPA